MATVELRAVTKIYGRHRALANVSLQAEGGNVCAVLGPNGAGKSTAMAIVASLLRPTSGSVLYENDTQVPRQAIGFCAHASLVYGDLTVYENLRFFAQLYRVSDCEARVQGLIARLALVEVSSQPARECSRGTLQRLAVARAIISRPRLLLLDEPFTGLDVESVTLLRTLIREETDAGTLVMLSTHDFAALAGLARHVVVLRRGRVVADCRRDSVLDESSLRAVYGEC